MALGEFECELGSVHARHIEIQDGDVECGAGGEGGESGFWSIGKFNINTPTRELVFEDAAVDGDIIHNKDSSALKHGRINRRESGAGRAGGGGEIEAEAAAFAEAAANIDRAT